MRNGSLGVLELIQHAQMALLITPMALEPLMEYEAVMVKCCLLPHTMRPTLLDLLQQRSCNNDLRDGKTREHGVNVDVTHFSGI